MPDIMLVVTLLTSGKLMQSERQDLSIYRAMGLPCTALRRSFSLRFVLVSLVGSDRLARCGHGPDGADADVWHDHLQLPAGVGRHRFAGGVIALPFTVFTCLACGKIKRARLTELMQAP